jgi:hypothetical protein
MKYIKAYFETCKTTDEERVDNDNTSGYQNNTSAAQPTIPGNENTGSKETNDHQSSTWVRSL